MPKATIQNERLKEKVRGGREKGIKLMIETPTAERRLDEIVISLCVDEY